MKPLVTNVACFLLATGLEDTLREQHAGLTAIDVCNFWTSLQVWVHLAGFCRKILWRDRLDQQDIEAARLHFGTILGSYADTIRPAEQSEQAGRDTSNLMEAIRTQTVLHSTENVHSEERSVDLSQSHSIGEPEVTASDVTSNGTDNSSDGSLGDDAAQAPTPAGTESVEGTAQLETGTAVNDDGMTADPNRECTDAPAAAPHLIPPRRTPNLQSSRERLSLVSALASELATIKQKLNRYCTADDLKKKHPSFILREHIDDVDLKELVDGTAFTPKAYAENLTLRKFGITSRETLKKDRKKLRKAEKAGLL